MRYSRGSGRGTAAEATLTTAAPVPPFTQHRSVLQTLVDEWDGMTTEAGATGASGAEDGV